jgi:hypothetical protein
MLYTTYTTFLESIASDVQQSNRKTGSDYYVSAFEITGSTTDGLDAKTELTQLISRAGYADFGTYQFEGAHIVKIDQIGTSEFKAFVNFIEESDIFDNAMTKDHYEILREEYEGPNGSEFAEALETLGVNISYYSSDFVNDPEPYTNTEFRQAIQGR